MRLSFFCVAIFYFNCCFSQISIKEIRLAPNRVFYDTTDKGIIYPLISTGDNHVDSLINSRIENDLFSPSDNHTKIEHLLQKTLKNLA